MKRLVPGRLTRIPGFGAEAIGDPLAHDREQYGR